jgi:hypothetical protein
LALPIGSGLDAVVAQRRHAKASPRGLSAIDENAPAFAGRARLSADPAIRCVRRPQTRRSDEAHNGDVRVPTKRAAAARPRGWATIPRAVTSPCWFQIVVIHFGANLAARRAKQGRRKAALL